MYLLSSMADLLEWSQDEDDAEGRRRNRQLGSCCCRSMNCFMKLSLWHTPTGTRITKQSHANTQGTSCFQKILEDEVGGIQCKGISIFASMLVTFRRMNLSCVRVKWESTIQNYVPEEKKTRFLIF